MSGDTAFRYRQKPTQARSFPSVIMKVRSYRQLSSAVVKPSEQLAPIKQSSRFGLASPPQPAHKYQRICRIVLGMKAASTAGSKRK